MNSIKRQLLLVTTLLFGFASFASAQGHQHGGEQEQEIKPPKVYLDTNPRAVQFQLARLDNQRLLLVERKDDDKKYLPVHKEILKRDGMQ